MSEPTFNIVANTRRKTVHLDTGERPYGRLAVTECKQWLEFWEASESTILPNCKRCARKARERADRD